MSRIYYTDAYCQAFDARVVRAFEHEGRPAVVLDRTAFYPTSGGQPFDTGTLSGAKVLDVVDTPDSNDGRILHIVDRAPGGTRVSGKIDWVRRFDQQGPGEQREWYGEQRAERSDDPGPEHQGQEGQHR